LLFRVLELGGRQTEWGLLLRLGEADLKFPTGKATLPAGELSSLDRMAALLIQHPTLTARIEGHTDASGRDEANLSISQARADAVKQALADRGVALERLEAIGLGEIRPIADPATKAGSQ
jgi:outer membrane protein OmpA-like peptidoglycan-associated protein